LQSFCRHSFRFLFRPDRLTSMKKGKFVVFDGIDGGGKSSIISEIARTFGKRAMVNQISDTFLGKTLTTFLHNAKKIADPGVLLALSFASFRERILNSIVPALKVGKLVLSDRFDSSGFAYQVHAQNGANLEGVFFKMREVMFREAMPDLYIFLDLDPKVGLRRKYSQNNKLNLFERQSLSFHRTVREGYRLFSKHVPSKIVDAGRPFEEVKTECMKIVENLIK